MNLIYLILWIVLFIQNILKPRGAAGLILRHEMIFETLRNRLSEKGNDLSVYNIYDDYFFFDKQYFYLLNKEWMTTSADEIFIDCGALNGGTIKDFVDYCGGKYNKIYSFEPIPSLYKQTLENINRMGIERVELIKKGVWNKKNIFNFNEDLGASRINNNGNITAEVVPIDEIIPDNEKVTFIKMDIEGAEYEALQGAAKTIRRCKPKLAICIYHKQQDIIEIPVLIKSICPDYKFYIRHHSIDMTETVLYAMV